MKALFLNLMLLTGLALAACGPVNPQPAQTADMDKVTSDKASDVDSSILCKSHLFVMSMHLQDGDPNNLDNPNMKSRVGTNVFRVLIAHAADFKPASPSVSLKAKYSMAKSKYGGPYNATVIPAGDGSFIVSMLLTKKGLWKVQAHITDGADADDCNVRIKL